MNHHDAAPEIARERGAQEPVAIVPGSVLEDCRLCVDQK